MQAQDLERRRPGFIGLHHLGVGGGEPGMAGPELRRARDAFAQEQQGLRILFQHVVRKSEEAGSQGRMKRIKPHVGLGDFDRPLRLSGVRPRHAEAPIHVVRIERNRFLEFGNRGLVPALPQENMPEVAVRHRQIRIEVHGLERAELAADLTDVGGLVLVTKAELLAMTNSSEKRESSVMMSRVMPSLK